MSASIYPNVYHGTLLDEIIQEQKLSAELVKRAAREVFVIIKEGLLRDGVVRINHFGIFKLKRVAARKGRNPKTGEAITIAGRAKVIFTPCKALREMIEPVHAKPIPIPTAATESSQLKSSEKPKRVAVQPVPELIPEPALLKIESEVSTAVEPVGDFEVEQLPEEGKKGGRDKLIYVGIAAIIIAAVAIKSMPRKVETLPQQITTPPVSELQIKPVEVESTSLPTVDLSTEEPSVAEITEEPESELAQIIATQSAQQRVELEVATEKSAALPMEDSLVDTAELGVTEVLQPTSDVIAERTINEPAVVIAEPALVEPTPVATTAIFFTERPYKPQAGNSLWRL
ncbi:MAG: hypothetical protein GQ470_04550 [Gammaproteobacteria bacterium]|nr:hypothetical protein [Gammaproteobacteria bacterium]